MNMHSKPVKIGLFFLGLIAVCGLVLLFKGNDAVAMAKEKRDGIVTAEQIKVSFDSVSGRLLKENVKEGDRVKKGDVLMVMDPTDTDLDIKNSVPRLPSWMHRSAPWQEALMWLTRKRILTKWKPIARLISRRRCWHRHRQCMKTSCLITTGNGSWWRPAPFPSWKWII